MRALAITGIVTASWMPLIIAGSLIRATPPSRRMSAGTRSSAITADAPASSAIFACSASTTSMMTPPLSISARPALTRKVASSRMESTLEAAHGGKGAEHGRIGCVLHGGVRDRLRDAASAFTSTARNRDLRRAQLALAFVWASEWGFAVALAVIAFRAGGTTAVGVVGAVRMLPAAVLAPFGAALADRLPRARI